MSDVAIICQGLGKQYFIGQGERDRSLRDVIARAATAPFRDLLRPGNGARGRDKPAIWALNDVSCQIRQGEVVGVIGRNGAGKSTLLKILSRITPPTTGWARIQGRVGALLEVGTGFHSELTGRENIYLNGAILGMKRAEIARKFDEIVVFAEVEQFIDTPVKRYSSGMYVRLAFAVAAHMETEILLVDEVLAVGDAQFQKKCFEQFRRISRGGRTIVFVSHNMSAVRHVCDRGVALSDGQIVDDGEIDRVADRYLATLGGKVFPGQGCETETFVIREFAIRSQGAVIKTFDEVEVRITATAKADVIDPGAYIAFLSPDDHRIAALDFKDFQSVAPVRKGESLVLGFRIKEFPILPGTYQIELHMKDMAHHKIELVPVRAAFDVVETPIYGGRKIDAWYGHVGLRAASFARTPGTENAGQ